MTIGRANVTRLAGPACELGEGPAYDLETDTAWWFDIVGRALHEHRFVTGETLVHALPAMGSVVAKVDARRQILAMEDGLYLRDVGSGDLARLAALEADLPGNRSNDGRVHPSGRLWIGTMGRHAEPGAGSIYWFDGREARPLFRGISIPNSICFSPDGRIGHFADTAAGTIWRVALDPATGLPTGAPERFLDEADLPLGGGFDGSVVDARGVLWNAAWGGGSVSGFRPDGSLALVYEVPAAQTSCPCFVGPRLDRLLVTSAWQGYGEAARRRDSGAGHTWVVDGGFEGQADPLFLLADDAATDRGQ